MTIRITIITILCLLITGCMSKMQGLESELKVRDFMDRAAALEKEKAYHQAAQVYAMVAEHYPSTSYHKLAVRKAALLNIHPGNPEIDYDAAFSWLQVYLKLPLSPKEREDATRYVSLVKSINDLQADLSHLVKEKKRLLELTQKQSSEIEYGAKRRKELEVELAHAWDELNKMKAVDVKMHRSKMEKSIGKSSQSVQKAPETTSDKGKTTHQSKQHTLVKDQEFYPYLIQVSSYKNKEDSMREAMILRDKGDSVCISHVNIAGKGDWYRVLVGFYRTPQAAQEAALELKKREYIHAFVVRPPFTVELGNFSDDEKLKTLKAHLISKGYSAYSLPNGAIKNSFRLLVGAFWKENEASTVIKDLQKEGFKPQVVRR